MSKVNKASKISTNGKHDEANPGISFIVWCNDDKILGRCILPTINPGYQVGEFDIQLVIVSPTAQARNLGHAYNLGAAHAMHPNHVFTHQDVQFEDREFVKKAIEMLSRPDVGGVGVIGSTIDTGAGFFHAPIDDQRGRLHGHWWPEESEVKVVDGFLMVTKETIPWSEEYESVHMFVEDYCLRLREAGKKIYTIASHVGHMSPGTINEAYWRSAYNFRRKWAHMLPTELPPLSRYVKDGLPGVHMQSEFDLIVL